MKSSTALPITAALFIAAVLTIAPTTCADLPREECVRLTVLYDNYILSEGCTADWGFACTVEGAQKNILFDTGTTSEILFDNMNNLGVEAADAELLIISHNHADHYGGLLAFLGRNSNLTAYLPANTSPIDVGKVEATGATAIKPNSPVEICENVHLTGPMGSAVIEQSMVIDTPKGLVIITGCAHPGIVAIVQKAKQMLPDKDVYLALGGFHLLNNSDSQVISIIQQLKNLGVRKAGASHCTGERAIELFQQEYGENFVPIGVGPITIPIVCEFTDDAQTDLRDFAVWARAWKSQPDQPTWDPRMDLFPPLFGDGFVSFYDLAVFAGYYCLADRPSRACCPDPNDGETGVGITSFLRWIPGTNVESHEVYFGKTNPPPLVATQSQAVYAPPVMDQNSVYYWRIDELNTDGKTTGQIWSFSTMPEEAWGPSPEDGATSAIYDPYIALSWRLGGLDTDGYTVSYVVNFGPDEDALSELDTVEATNYDVSGRFAPMTTYYWRIDTKRKLNRPPFNTTTTPGNIWRFTTGP